MAIIWGFDLSQMHWGAFSSREMFDRRWNLRKERFIVYQIAMLTGLAAECTATYSLSKYNFHQTHIEESTTTPGATEYNESLIRSAICTIVFCVFVATLFGADFFFLLFFPRRKYPGWYHRTKKGAAVVITLGMLASAVASTVVLSSHEAEIYNVGEEGKRRLVEEFATPPLRYRDWPQNIAWVVLLWIAFVSTAASTYLMFKASAYDLSFGTDPTSPIPGVAPRDDDDDEEKGITPAPARRSRESTPSSREPVWSRGEAKAVDEKDRTLDAQAAVTA